MDEQEAEASQARVERLLLAWNRGKRRSRDKLIGVVYEELRQLARRTLASERGRVLEPTDLVHETYLRLVDEHLGIRWRDRSHLFAIAVRLMRRILVEHARRRRAAKRGGKQVRLTLKEALDVPARREEDFDDLREALSRLGKCDPRLSRVVQLRYFAGFTIAETAQTLGVSPVTVERDWRSARAWLWRALREE